MATMNKAQLLVTLEQQYVRVQQLERELREANDTIHCMRSEVLSGKLQVVATALPSITYFKGGKRFVKELVRRDGARSIYRHREIAV